MDLTWDRDLILLGQPPTWILKNDKEFRNHAGYRIENTTVEKCDTSVKKEAMKKITIKGFKMIKGFSKQPNKVKDWLKSSLKAINLNDINRVLGKLERHVSQEKEHEEEK